MIILSKRIDLDEKAIIRIKEEQKSLRRFDIITQNEKGNEFSLKIEVVYDKDKNEWFAKTSSSYSSISEAECIEILAILRELNGVKKC